MAALILIFGVLFAARLGLAFWYASKQLGAGAIGGPAAILQPLLPGDSALTSTLAANAAALPGEHLYWLVDEDDAEGQAAARRREPEGGEVDARVGSGD